MKTRKIVAILFISIVLVSCAPKATATPMQTFTPTIVNSPTETSIPFPTAKPTNTPVPSPQIPSGTIYFEWNMGDNTSPYVVWGAQLRDSMNGNCQDFICEGKDFRNYDDTIWKFLGKGDYGVMDFSFDINKNRQVDLDELFDTFNIRFGQDIGFDSITGLTQDGKMLAYGFLVNGESAIPYGESSNLSLATLTDAKNKNLLQSICGIVDPNVLGDESFSVASGSGALIFGFSEKGFNDSSPAISKGYSLISLTISSAPRHLISPENACP